MAKYQTLARRMVADCPGMRVARATRVLASVFNDEFRALDLQASQHGVLTFVALAGPGGLPSAPWPPKCAWTPPR